ncbi:Diphthamide biosynthesis protein 1 [Exophiala oligosperma]
MDEPSIPGAFPTAAEESTTTTNRTPKRRFVGRRTADAQAKQRHETNGSVEETTAVVAKSQRKTPRALNQIPAEILDDPDIQAAIGLLPHNYSFEIHKTIHRIRTLEAKRVALQFPEGLLMFATTISDILTQFCPGTETLIMGDVTYGACCIDDYTARALGCDLLVHYAHSCLIPVSATKIATLYIFVDISIDVKHLVSTLSRNISPGKTIAMVGTIQFNATLHTIRPALEAEGLKLVVPQAMPLSKGEVLGCTAPKIGKDQNVDLILYLGDGRFHLEAAMIANPDIPAYRYDPYSRKLTRETYSHDEMLDMRSSAIGVAKKAKKWGLILGALGRQGNPHTLTMIQNYLAQQGIPYINLLLSEIFPGKLALFEDVDCWVQIACPRLSIDWGYAFPRPLLTPYEALVVLGGQQGWERGDGTYPMDFYANSGLGRTTEKLAAQVTVSG